MARTSQQAAAKDKAAKDAQADERAKAQAAQEEQAKADQERLEAEKKAEQERLEQEAKETKAAEEARIKQVEDMHEYAKQVGNVGSQLGWNPPPDTAHSIQPSEFIPGLGKDVQGLDARFANPERSIKASGPPTASSLDWADEARNMIQAIVHETMAKEGIQASVGSVPVEFTRPPVVAPPSFKKHYRNDESPDLVIQALDMTALDRDERPQANPIPGKYIKFRMGHLYTNDDMAIQQIDWMKSNARLTSEGETLGGNPSIYEDDGSVIYQCTAGCSFVTASKAGYKAHMKATHGIEVNL